MDQKTYNFDSKIKQSWLYYLSKTKNQRLFTKMASLSNEPILYSKLDEAFLVERILSKVQEKLQVLVSKIGKQNIQFKEDSEILTRDEPENLLYQPQTTTISLKEKSIKILYQTEVLQFLLAEKSLPQISTDSKAYDIGVKKSFESAQSKKQFESYIDTSFAGKEKDKDEALKEVILTLCNESELQLKSRLFLKGEIEEHFSKGNMVDQISVEESNNETDQYLEKFIGQIGQLREQIQHLQERNQALLKQNSELSQRLLAKKEQTYFQNPELISDKFHVKFIRNPKTDNCQSCFGLLEDNKLMKFQLKQIQENLFEKENTIKKMNGQFSKEILKYNTVFKNLSNQNDELRKYINEDLAYFISGLQNQINQLKSTDKYQKFETSDRRHQTDFFDRQNQYYYADSKLRTNNFLGIQSQKFLNQNVFSNCSIKNHLPEPSRSKIMMKMPQRSKSKHSKQSIQSRPYSYKSSSPNLQIKKTIEKRHANGMFQRPNFNCFERD